MTFNAIMLIPGGLMAWIIIDSLKSGECKGRYGTRKVSRANDPFGYWAMMGFQSLFLLIFIYYVFTPLPWRWAWEH
jgi:hypothetical protein